MIAMGIGRFAYTPLLPPMQQALHFSDSIAGYLAASNYLGYLLGAIFAGAMGWQHQRLLLLRISLVINIATTGLIGCTTSINLWILLRFISGVTCAMVFVFVSGIVLDHLAKHQRMSLAGWLYSGVGLGIAISGLAVPFLVQRWDWDGAWLGLMILCVVLVGIVWWGLRESTDPDPKNTPDPTGIASPPQSPPTKSFIWVMIAYGCEGLGYIVTGTFLVALAAETPSLAHNPPSLSWVIAGIAAFPSCIIWSWLAKHWGYLQTLIVIFLLQAFGIFLPVLQPNAVGIYGSSLLFGATFMGISTLTTAWGRQLSPVHSSRIIGYFTAVFGAGQMIGPIGAGLLTDYTHSYSLSLAIASSVLLLGASCLFIQYMYHRKKQQKSAKLIVHG